jgi:hypothetical protein
MSEEKKLKPLTNEDRTKWRQMVKQNPHSFVKAPEEAKADGPVCFDAVKKDGLLLEHCSKIMQSNRNIVLEAVKNNAEAIHYADESMRADADIVQHMVRQRGQLLRLASEELRGNLDLVLEVVHDLWFTAEYVADSLRFSEEFWKEVIEQDPETGWMAFSYAPVELRSDPALMMEAIKVDPMAFKFASDELRNDSGFVLEAVKVNWIALKHASRRVRSDAKVVLEALSQDFEALQYASTELLADPTFALEAAGYHGRALAGGGVARALQDDKDWVLKAVRKNPVALVYADDDHREDRNVVNSSMAGALGKCSGLLWKIDDSSMKWAAGTMRLAEEAIQAEIEAAELEAAEADAASTADFGEGPPEAKGRSKNSAKAAEITRQASRHLH